MHRKFIALIIASAIAVTGLSAVPARAEGGDVAKVLAGLAVLAIIGVAIDKSRDDAPPAVVYAEPPRPTVIVPRPKVIVPRPLPHGVSRNALPETCVRNVNTDKGKRNVLSANCLDRNYAYTSALPSGCVVHHWNKNRHEFRKGYAQNCLKKHGYRIARK